MAVQTNRHFRLIALGLAVLAIAATISWIGLHSYTADRHTQARQGHLIERTERAAAEHFNHSYAEQQRISIPVVTELTDVTCVELRTNIKNNAGTYVACYSPGGELVEQRTTIGF